MLSNFITNDGETELRSRLLALVENGEEIKFLVSFFYFQSIQQLYEGLKNNPNSTPKILVGMDADILNNYLIEVGREISNQNRTQVKSSSLFC